MSGRSLATSAGVLERRRESLGAAVVVMVEVVVSVVGSRMQWRWLEE